MRRRPSPATVISLIALFVALGGTSYAVVKLPAASVGARELKANAVTSAKIRNGAVAVEDLAPGARGGRGPRGAQGPPGVAGAPGAPGDAAPPEPWKPLPLASGWTTTGSHASPAYRKDQRGRVYLRGNLTKLSGIPEKFEVMARLPEGYRPIGRMSFAVAIGTDSADAHGRVDIRENGEVFTRVAGIGETDSTSLDAISFWTD